MVADDFDDLEEALQATLWASDAGEEAVAFVEVIHDDGTRETHDRKAVDRLIEPLERQQAEERKARPKPTYTLDLRSPDGRWGPYDSFSSLDKVTAAEAEWSSLLGADRVRVRPYGSNP